MLISPRAYLQEPMARVALRGHLWHPYRRWRFATFGAGSLIDRPEWLYGTHRIAIGNRVVFLAHAWLAAERATWERPEPGITIADGSMFRMNAALSATAGITIEENVLVASHVSIIDSDHTITDADRNPLFNPSESAPIRIGAGSWIGERVTILGGSDIGRKCVIGAHSVVRGTIPDHSVAAGVPAKVVGSTSRSDAS